jgi:4'-phosphopantetheinyl transferase
MSTAARIWTISAQVEPDVLARYHEVLDDAERARASGFAHEQDRRCFVVAHGALRLLLGRELGVAPQRLTFTAGRHGKPELSAAWPRVHLSLSHSGTLVAVATHAARPVGVDIQQQFSSANAVALATRFFAPAEACYVAQAPDEASRADRLTWLWTRKEAVVKAAGGQMWSNLRMPVHGRDVVECIEPPGPHRVTDVAAPEGFRIAVAVGGTEPHTVETANRLSATIS